MKEVEYQGYVLPKNTLVNISTLYTHYMEEYWSQPLRFDPNVSVTTGQNTRNTFTSGFLSAADTTNAWASTLPSYKPRPSCSTS